MSRTDDNRLAALHGLRGLSALGVAIFFHFAHFGGTTDDYPFSSLPGIHWVYAQGLLLVDLFFVLSGVIVTHRYLAPVAAGTSHRSVAGWQLLVLTSFCLLGACNADRPADDVRAIALTVETPVSAG